ncbi:hypothetical protein BT96DRAFT_923126 [Gymnopus androsaceus JB14]|uniref:Uncharacterized protein n=1 Tax=Gymnopus androsaceus JB14 TaxID=1447944 RepID=A0A6A4HBG9_9AGAR|nr:hypothetical protein BT96DRAFT_923126 [Gymnopus androsaceus JB14]
MLSIAGASVSGTGSQYLQLETILLHHPSQTHKVFSRNVKQLVDPLEIQIHLLQKLVWRARGWLTSGFDHVQKLWTY